MATKYAFQNRCFCRIRHAMDMTIVGSREDGGQLNYDASSLDSLYRGRLVELRELAESQNISKGGSVEVLRARLIRNLVVADLDLSWDGIQMMSHN